MTSFEATHTITDDQVISRMFDLVQSGQVDNSEYTLLDAVIQARLRRAYEHGAPDVALLAQTAA